MIGHGGLHHIGGHHLDTIDGDITIGWVLHTTDTVGIITTDGTITDGTIGTTILIIIEEVMWLI